MAGHVAELCRLNNVTVGPHSSDGRANRREKHIDIRPVKSAVTYAFALHELGHILGRNPNRRLLQEAAAWDWARAHSVAWPAAAEKTARRALASYLRWALNKRKRGINIIVPDDYPIKEIE